MINKEISSSVSGSCLTYAIVGQNRVKYAIILQYIKNIFFSRLNCQNYYTFQNNTYLKRSGNVYTEISFIQTISLLFQSSLLNKQTRNQDGWEVTMFLYQKHGGDPPTTFDIA